MLERKRELHKNGIPPDAEHEMVASMNGRGDSLGGQSPEDESADKIGALCGKQSKKSRTRTAARAKSSQTS